MVCFMSANVPCNFLVLLVVEKGNVISVVSALTTSALPFPSLTLEDHGSGEEKKGPQGLQIMSAGEGGCLQCTLLQKLCW